MPEQSEVFEFEAGDPLKLSVADLALPEARDRLARRDEMALRKAALRGARQLFRRAFAERKARGGSFQFAPHWWFMDRLTREEPRRARTGSRHRQVAPPFQRVFAPRVRQHFHAVLRAAQIDLILIEDGVGLKRIERVLRELFDLYHKHRRRPARGGTPVPGHPEGARDAARLRPRDAVQGRRATPSRT